MTRVSLEDHMRFVTQMPICIMDASIRLEELLDNLNAGVQVVVYDCSAERDMMQVSKLRDTLGKFIGPHKTNFTLHHIRVPTTSSGVQCAVFRKVIWHPRQNLEHIAFIDEGAIAARIKDIVSGTPRHKYPVHRGVDYVI